MCMPTAFTFNSENAEREFTGWSFNETLIVSVDMKTTGMSAGT